MARMNKTVIGDSEDELPELIDLLGRCNVDVPEIVGQQGGKERHAPEQHAKQRERNAKPLDDAQKITSPQRNISGIFHQKEAVRKQRLLSPLKVSNGNSLRLPEPSDAADRVKALKAAPQLQAGEQRVRCSPRRTAKATVDYSKFAVPTIDDESSLLEDEDTYTDLSGFIVSDSESIDDGADVHAGRNDRWRSPKRSLFLKETAKSRKPDDAVVVNLISPVKDLYRSKVRCTSLQPSIEEVVPRTREASFDANEPQSVLEYNPKKGRSPHKLLSNERPVTPPSSPTKGRLLSPSKKHRIPATPHRPSIDAFWSQDVINDWNDQYSPRKTPKSRRKPVFTTEDSGSDSGAFRSVSPTKSPSKSPAKRDKAVIARRKAFNERKHDIATSFLAEVDQVITNGKVAQLAESTGGIKIVWSKKLSSTAGRANWRREAIRRKLSDGTTSDTTHRHHASIELAEKVIDDELRLFNVLAHEYCHLANFMVSGIKDNPHGKEFKQWAAKCTKAFGDRGVEVTTKHSYEISYKYVWTCSNVECGIEYKRHSKSINPTKHTCGACKGKLLQIQPAPRKGAEPGKRSEYQEFVKREYERVKRENPGAGFGEIMAILGREFRSRKKIESEVIGDVEKKCSEKSVDEILKDLDGLDLGS